MNTNTNFSTERNQFERQKRLLIAFFIFTSIFFIIITVGDCLKSLDAKKDSNLGFQPRKSNYIRNYLQTHKNHSPDQTPYLCPKGYHKMGASIFQAFDTQIHCSHNSRNCMKYSNKLGSCKQCYFYWELLQDEVNGLNFCTMGPFHKLFTYLLFIVVSMILIYNFDEQ